jgi:hypothetical protein
MRWGWPTGRRWWRGLGRRARVAAACAAGAAVVAASLWAVLGAQAPGRKGPSAAWRAPSVGVAAGSPLPARGSPARTAALPAEPAAAGAAGPATAAGLGDVVVRRVEETASVRLEVRDVAAAFEAVRAIAQGLGGYVESSTLRTGPAAAGPALPSPPGLPVPVPPPGPGPSASLVLAVPQGQLPACLQQVQALGKVLEATVGGQDVTGQYVDLQARIAALEAERQSYLALLSKASAIGDILQIQSALTGVQTQLEQLQGQLQELQALTAMARVTVLLEPVPAPRTKAAAGPAARLAEAFRASAHALAEGTMDLAMALAWLLPWGLLGGAGYGVYRGVAGRRRARA